MLSLERMRKRLPLVVVIFLLLIVVMLIGIACACATDHPMQAVDRALSAIPTMPPLIELWSLIVLLLAPVTLFVATPLRAHGRASPPLLQRFLL